MAHVELVVASEQAACHPREIRRHAQFPDGFGEWVGQVGALHAAAAEQEQRLRARGEHRRRAFDLARTRVDVRDRTWAGRRGAPRENGREMPFHVPALKPCAQLGRRPHPGLVKLTDRAFRIEKIERRLEEDGARNTATCFRKCALDRRHEVAYPFERFQPLHVRAHQRDLVDVLERAAPLEQCRRSTTDDHHGRLGQLGVLDRGDRVGEAGAGRHAGDSRHARETGHRVGRIDRRGFVPHVDDAYPRSLGAEQQRGDVSPAKREHEPDPVHSQRVGHETTTVFGPVHFSLALAFKWARYQTGEWTGKRDN